MLLNRNPNSNPNPDPNLDPNPNPNPNPNSNPNPAQDNMLLCGAERDIFAHIDFGYIAGARPWFDANLMPVPERLKNCCTRGCNPMSQRLQLYVPEAATPCARGCNPMSQRLQPYASGARALQELLHRRAVG